MFEDIIRKIRGLERNHVSDLSLQFSDGLPAMKIDRKNFHGFECAGKKSVAFVDGGSSNIFSTGDMSLSLVRACCVVFRDKKRTFLEKSEFFVLAESASNGNEIIYNVSFFPVSKNGSMERLEFSSFDETLRRGLGRADISSVADAARRFAELSIARNCAEKKRPGIMVLDGNLKQAYTHEAGFMSSLQECCMKNEVVLCALSKSSSLYAEDGSLISSVLLRISPQGQWFYNIADVDNESLKAGIFFVKLHPKSRHVFRFEILVHQKEHASEVISHLSLYSKDPVFLGYPYGLIEADRIARVSNQEKESVKSRLSAALGKDFGNAHDILDRISF